MATINWEKDERRYVLFILFVYLHLKMDGDGVTGNNPLMYRLLRRTPVRSYLHQHYLHINKLTEHEQRTF